MQVGDGANFIFPEHVGIESVVACAPSHDHNLLPPVKEVGVIPLYICLYMDFLMIFQTFSEEEDDEELVKVSSIATIIISNTFKAIETGLTSGKLQVLLKTPSTESVPVAANLATSPESGLVRC